MSDKTALLVSKVLAALFVVFGILVSFSSLTGLAAAGLAGVGSRYASQSGKDIGYFPYGLVMFGALLVLVLAVTYFVTAYGLFKRKVWAYKGLFVLGGVGILSDLLAIQKINTSTLFWSAVYIYLGYVLHQKAKLFKNK